MSELLTNSLLDVLSCLEQMDKDQLWVETYNKTNKLANAITLALEQLTPQEVDYNGYIISVDNAKKTLEGACTQ